MLALAGSHRTGKSTLAKAFAERYDFDLLLTDTGSVFKKMGLDPSATYDFSTRMRVQRAILKYLDGLYGQVKNDMNTITDRSPLDLLIYTIAEVQGNNLSEEETEDLQSYISECFEVMNRRFNMTMIVQPGIEVKVEGCKGSLNTAYMEHLNLLALGLMNDERIETAVAYIPRDVLDLDERVECVYDTFVYFLDDAELSLLGKTESGIKVH